MKSKSQMSNVIRSPDCFNDLEKWNQDKDMLNGRNALVQALGKIDYQAEVFKDDQFCHYALTAYQNDQISQAQMATVLLM